MGVTPDNRSGRAHLYHTLLRTKQCFLTPTPNIFNASPQLAATIQEGLRMQRDRATRYKYEISHLKRLAIGE